ncbi:MAG: outer membrane protein assembly factor BamB [Natronomonas sp.]|jgi:outer membrane protein assembly factor BamB
MSPRQSQTPNRRKFLQLAGCTLGSAALVRTGETARASESADWRFDTGGPVFSSPTVVDETVYIGSQSGAVYALDAETGERIWRFGTSEPVDSSPFVINRGGEGTDRLVLVGCDDTNLYAFDADTGEQEWRVETNGRIQGSPVVGAETLFFTSDNDGLYAVDTTSGERSWFSEYQMMSHASPTIIEDTVFVRGQKLRALDPRSGWQRWAFDLGSGTYSSPTVADGTVYVGDRERNGGPNSAGNLYAIDAESGDREWVFDTDEFVDASPTVVEETVYVGGWKTRFRSSDDGESGTGSVFALATDDGTERWQFETDGRVLSSPTVADGVVFAGSWDGTVYGLDAVTGDERVALETGGRVSSSPTVEGGRLYVGSNDGYVYALSAGVSGTSTDSRVQLGTLGHTGSKRLPDALESKSRLDTGTARALGAGGAVGFLSGSGLLYYGDDRLGS